MGCSAPEEPAQSASTATAVEADAGAGTADAAAADAARPPEHAADSGVCTPMSLDGALPLDVEIDTRGKASAREASCGGTDAPEVALSFTAPSTGTFSFTTEGSRFNTVLYALDGDCAGPELGCNDDRAGLASALELDLEAGQSVVLVIDGFEGQAGRAHLRLSELARSSCCEGSLAPGCGSAAVETCVCALDDFCCTTAWDDVCAEYAANECAACQGGGGGACEAVATFGPDDAMLSAALDGTSDAASASCGNPAAPDVLFGFTAEAAGAYTFATRGSAIADTVLAVLDGSGCDGAELACNDDDGGELDSRVTVELAAGQSVTLLVESWDDEPGEVALAVSRDAPAEVASCTPFAVTDALPLTVSGQVQGDAGALEPSCALFGSHGEVVYELVAPDDGTYRFDTRGSEADTILQLLDGDCSGAELACNDDPDDGELSAQLEVPLVAGQHVLLVVDSFDGAGSYVLGVARISSEADVDACCEAHASSGCAAAAVETCVCAADARCCEGSWDALCAAQAQGCGGC
jgi:hypothetical protein